MSRFANRQVSGRNAVGSEIDRTSKSLDERKLFTLPYDLTVDSLVKQIRSETIHLRPLTDRPRYRRKAVWSKRLASRLIESILLNIPIPPCYFSQNQEFELDVIDGQQRLYSIFRFLNNEFALSNLEVLSELNKLKFSGLAGRLQRKIETYILRVMIITSDSDPEIQFDVFERLNTHKIPLNSQELRNCMYRGSLNELLGDLAEHEPWLKILGRAQPDERMRGEELILRFLALYMDGWDQYRTPQKHWLNEFARKGRNFTPERIALLSEAWKQTIENCLLVFAPNECFRRYLGDEKRSVINRSLMDLVMTSFAGREPQTVRAISCEFRKGYTEILGDKEFQDLIDRSSDHRLRTLRRLEIWNERLVRRTFDTVVGD